MIIGIGIDIVAVDRIAGLLERRGERAIRRLYTETEREYCEGMPHSALHYAARFAAKEAFVKALGTGFTQGIRWRDIGIVNDERGKPDLVLQGAPAEWMANVGATTSYVSLTHDKIHAAAVVVLEKLP